MIKTFAIALTTAKDSMRQPVFYLLLGVAAALLLIFPLIPYYTFGEDVKMVKDTGLATILVVALLQSLLTASTSIAEEIEGRTAITLLSKPITRRQFIVGKYFGILLTVLVIFIVLGVIFSLMVYWKVGIDARESSRPSPLPAERLEEVWQVLPGLVLAFFEVAVLASVSVAISTRLPMLVNLVVCLALFVVGHLTPILVQVSAERFEVVGFMAGVFSTVLPQLEPFNMQAAISTGTFIPAAYLLSSFLYCAVYSTLAILLAFIMFEDRDLA